MCGAGIAPLHSWRLEEDARGSATYGLSLNLEGICPAAVMLVPHVLSPTEASLQLLMCGTECGCQPTVEMISLREHKLK